MTNKTGLGERGDSGDVAIAFEKVSHRWGAVTVLSDISMNVKAGEFVSIIGPSGCGKTTCLHMVANEITPTIGKVYVNGKCLDPTSRDLSYMFSRDCLFPWRTALENVMLPLEAQHIPKRERRARALEMLGVVGLRERAEDFPAQLSSGMRQRVAIARTFVQGAGIILMDEPFSALDTQTKLRIEDVLMGIWEEQRCTVLHVTHDLGEAIRLSDRIVIMSKRPGRIKSIVANDLSRPRSTTTLEASHDYHQMYERLWEFVDTEFEGGSSDE